MAKGLINPIQQPSHRADQNHSLSPGPRRSGGCFRLLSAAWLAMGDWRWASAIGVGDCGWVLCHCEIWGVCSNSECEMWGVCYVTTLKDSQQIIHTGKFWLWLAGPHIKVRAGRQMFQWQDMTGNWTEIVLTVAEKKHPASLVNRKHLEGRLGCDPSQSSVQMFSRPQNKGLQWTQNGLASKNISASLVNRKHLEGRLGCDPSQSSLQMFSRPQNKGLQWTQNGLSIKSVMRSQTHTGWTQPTTVLHTCLTWPQFDASKACDLRRQKKHLQTVSTSFDCRPQPRGDSWWVILCCRPCGCGLRPHGLQHKIIHVAQPQRLYSSK